MIEALIQLLVVVLILAVVYWVASVVLTHFGAPAFMLQILGVILALLFVLALLSFLNVGHLRWPYGVKP